MTTPGGHDHMVVSMDTVVISMGVTSHCGGCIHLLCLRSPFWRFWGLRGACFAASWAAHWSGMPCRLYISVDMRFQACDSAASFGAYAAYFLCILVLLVAAGTHFATPWAAHWSGMPCGLYISVDMGS